MDHQQPSSSNNIGGKNNRTRPKVFQYSWLKLDIFKNWLMPHENHKKAHCRVCNKDLLCGKSELIKHARGKLHVTNIDKSCNIMPTTLLLETEYDSEEKDFIKIETSIAQMDMELSKQKCTQVKTYVLEKKEIEKLILILRNQKFSIFIDENTSISNKKMFYILVKYVSSQSKKCVTQLLELIYLKANCSIDHFYSEFEYCFKKKGIPLSNIIGLAYDNASITIENLDSFAIQLKKETSTLVVLRCMCYSSYFIANEACAKLPDSCENLLYKVATYFSDSVKKSTILCDFQNFFKVERYKIRKLSNTKCLILQNCVIKLLQYWDDLKHYFQLEIAETKSSSAVIIHNILNDNKVKAYMLFLKYSLNYFNDLNALFQGRNVLIHKLAESSEHLIKQIGFNFLLPEVLENISVHTINSDNFLPIISIYVGPECETFLQSFEFSTEIRATCLSFYITVLTRMIERLPYNDKLLREFKFLDPSISLSIESRLTFPDLGNVGKHFKISDITALAYEWRMLPIIFNDEEKINLASMEIEEMWKKIFEKKKFNGALSFPNLENLVHIIMALPQSNSKAEKIFSFVTDVKNKRKNQLKISKYAQVSFCAFKARPVHLLTLWKHLHFIRQCNAKKKNEPYTWCPRMTA